MELLILSHAPTRILAQGFIPAAIDLQLNVTILTDCVSEHLARANGSSLYSQCKLIECDVFNPLAVARFVSVHGGEFSGVLATDAALRASAAVMADYLRLPGPSWRSAVLCDQRLDLSQGFDPMASEQRRQIINCYEQDADLASEWFPVTVQPLETGATTGGSIIRTHEDLKRRLADLRYGYALVESHRENEQVYALDILGSSGGLTVLCGSRIAFDDDEVRTKRVQSFMPRPPRCDELLTLLSGFDLGLGRHHVEYAVVDNGFRIREIHNGLHDDDSEFTLDDQLDGNLFSETIKASVGMPAKALRLLRVDAMPAAVLDAAV